MTKQIAMYGTYGTYEIDYSWDNRNRLVDVQMKDSLGRTSQDVAYNYDAFDRLITRTSTTYAYSGSGTTPASSASATQRFVYDSPSAGSGQGNMVLAFNGTGALTDRYLWGPAVDQILADEQFSPTTSGEMPTAPGTTNWTITDNQGTVHDLVNYAALADHLVFDAFGNLSSSSSPFIFQPPQQNSWVNSGSGSAPSA
jgi:YD repeat-containing protein